MAGAPLALVTGATGFAGSHVVDRLLDAGYRVRALVRRTSNLRWVPHGRVETVTADVRDPAALERAVAGAASVFHFGGVTRVARPQDFFRVNTAGTEALARAFLQQAPGDGLFLFCSSLAASGPAPAADRPRREEDPPRPIGPYGESKLAAERWLAEHAAPRVRLVCVRPPTIYGPRDEAVLAFFRWVAHGWLPLPAPRGARVSIVHVEDLARACLALAEGGAAGCFHVSDLRTYGWEELGAAAGRALGKRLRDLRIPAWVARLVGALAESAGRVSGGVPVVNRAKVREMLEPYWVCDGSRAQAAGFAPRYGLEEGFAQTVEWYRAEGWL
jgi:nucleoside-diphosphate-sugar epimerase